MNKDIFKNIKLKKEFVRNEDCIIFLLKLKNGNLITCSQDKEINIYEKITFDLLLSWTGHLNSINSICELNDSRIVSCSDDKRISIWKYNITTKKVIQEIIFLAHNSFINKVISLNDNNFASCSEDNNIYIWNSKPPYNIKCSLIGHPSEVTSIIQLTNNKIVSTSSKKNLGIMKIWTLNSNNSLLMKEDTIYNVFCYCINSLVEINNNKVAVGGYKIIKIININNSQIELDIEYHNCLISSLTLLNNGCIVSASEEGNINIMDQIVYKNIKNLELAHDMIIFSLCSLDNNTFCSASKDGIIKIWTY